MDPLPQCIVSSTAGCVRYISQGQVKTCSAHYDDFCYFYLLISVISALYPPTALGTLKFLLPRRQTLSTACAAHPALENIPISQGLLTLFHISRVLPTPHSQRLHRAPQVQLRYCHTKCCNCSIDDGCYWRLKCFTNI